MTTKHIGCLEDRRLGHWVDVPALRHPLVLRLMKWRSFAREKKIHVLQRGLIARRITIPRIHFERLGGRGVISGSGEECVPSTQDSIPYLEVWSVLCRKRWSYSIAVTASGRRSDYDRAQHGAHHEHQLQRLGNLTETRSKRVSRYVRSASSGRDLSRALSFARDTCSLYHHPAVSAASRVLRAVR